MEVKIGIQHTSRELVIDTDASSDEVDSQVTEAVSSDGIVNLTDTKGHKWIVPADRIAYVEIGGGVSGKVGFRS